MNPHRDVSSLVSAAVKRMEISPIRRMSERAKHREDVINFAAGQPNFPTPTHIVEAAKRALDEGRTLYTPIQGTSELRSAIAAHISKRCGINVTSNEILVTFGATEAILVSILGTIDPGDEVLIPEPGFPLYRQGVTLANGKSIGYPLRPEEGFRLDVERLKELITPKTKMIIVNSPSNPTGSVLSKNEAQSIVDIACDHDLIVVSDEAYDHIIYDDEIHYSMASFNELQDRVILLNSFSKTYAMTGWRIGYIYLQKDLAAQISVLLHCIGLCQSSILQAAALAAITGPQKCVEVMVAEYDRRRNATVPQLNKVPGVKAWMPKGTFYNFIDIRETGLSSQQAADLLLEKAGVSVVPGDGFGNLGEGFLRTSLALNQVTIDEAIQRMRTTFINI